MTDAREVPALLLRAEALCARAAALADKRRPLVLRLLQAHQAKALNDKAEDLLDEIHLRLGRPPRGDGQPERVGGFTRTAWVRGQWAIGTVNALSMIWALSDGRWIAAFVSLLSMFACTLWILPRQHRKIKR